MRGQCNFETTAWPHHGWKSDRDGRDEQDEQQRQQVHQLTRCECTPNRHNVIDGEARASEANNCTSETEKRKRRKSRDNAFEARHDQACGEQHTAIAARQCQNATRTKPLQHKMHGVSSARTSVLDEEDDNADHEHGDHHRQQRHDHATNHRIPVGTRKRSAGKHHDQASASECGNSNESA